ncbi:MAG TPA: hypothetical protein VGJ84_05250 [Polyangiaceae bacterium]|jgi:hypothetical protein
MSLPTLDQRIRARIEEFTLELTTLVRQSAVESLREALGASSSHPQRRRLSGADGGRRGRGRSAPVGSRSATRAKGAKRDPDELKALTERLHQYVGDNSGQRIEEIARGMGITTRELNLPVKKLIAAKQIKTKGHKRATQYFAR